MPTQTLVLRLAFVVEDTQIPLLPAPKSGANRKAIPKWDGFENRCEKSMPVRAKIEDEQQGKQ
jgi:hypothetical protein